MKYAQFSGRFSSRRGFHSEQPPDVIRSIKRQEEPAGFHIPKLKEHLRGGWLPVSQGPEQLQYGSKAGCAELVTGVPHHGHLRAPDTVRPRRLFQHSPKQLLGAPRRFSGTDRPPQDAHPRVIPHKPRHSGRRDVVDVDRVGHYTLPTEHGIDDPLEQIVLHPLLNR